MRAVSSTSVVIVGTVILIALVVVVERHIRRSSTRPSLLSRQTRLGANDALRRRLASKVVTEVGKQKQEIERMQQGTATRVDGRDYIG